MKKKKTLILLIFIILLIITGFITFDFIKSKNNRKNDNEENEGVILKDETFSGHQFPVFTICKNDLDMIDYTNICQTDESYKPYLTVMSPTLNVKTFPGTNYTTGILFKDNYINLIDVKERKKFILDLGENDSYKLLINKNDKILGVLYQNESESGFYSYKLKKSIYNKEYDEIDLKDEILIGSKGNQLYILNEEEEKVIKKLDNTLTTINDIEYAKNIDNLIHIRSRNTNGEFEYFIYNKTNDTLNKISGFYEDISFTNKTIYAIKNNEIEIYDINGKLIKTNTIKKGTHSKIFENYIIAIVGKDIKIINMENNEETTLLENALNIWISEEKLDNSGKDIVMLFQEIDFEEYPKIYEITFTKNTKEVKIKNLN